jgi:hypothetical protein
VGRRFCENCGAAVGETTNFCPNCGAAQRPDPDVPTGPPPTTPEPGRISTSTVPDIPPPPEQPQRNTIRYVIIFLIAFAVLAAILITIVAAVGGTKKASKQSFTKTNYAELATNPNSFKGAQVNIVGRIFRNPEVSGNRTSFQMFADPENSEWNTLVHTDDAPSGLSSGDHVRVQGTVEGAFEGENAFGGNVRAVEVKAHSVEVTEDPKGKRRP